MQHLGAAIIMGLAAIGVSLSLAIVYYKTADSITRQPELLGAFRTLMILGFAFIEAIALYGLVIAYLLITAT